MRIKTFEKNKYILSKEGVWVRNLCSTAKNIDINNLYSKEKSIWLNNEFSNIKKSKLDLPPIQHENIIICSDGYGWEEKQKILASVPYNLVKIIGTNQSLSKWNMVGSKAELKRAMSFYVVNNPYKECVSYLPKKHNYYPDLVASLRTNSDFINQYKGEIFFYKPSDDLDYSSPPNILGLRLDDYRNPICAAISLSYKLGAKKILLFCCDDAFEDERPNSIKMENGLYQYPQHIMSQNIIDQQLYWLSKNDIKIFDHSCGIKYKNAEYIKQDDILSFFSKEC